MFTAFLKTQNAAAIVLVFVGTFLVSLWIGRFLKRRAGVRLGPPFQFFCLVLAFYAAVVFADVHASWRNHVGALLFLLGTGVLVALINRYIWDLYFEQRRQIPIPHFVREVVGLLIFLVAVLIVLSAGYHAQRELKTLLAGSGILAIILGFAGQNLFGGIIAGTSLQINRPFRVGDWLKVGDQAAEVMEINWRSIRLRTNDGIYLDIPNYELARQTITNLHYPTEVHAMRIRIGIDYTAAPNRVKDALKRAATSAFGVLKEPAVKVFLVDFGDHAVTYEIKFYMGNHSAINEVEDAIRTNMWYELRRKQINIPFPIRTLRLERKPARTGNEDQEQALAILRNEAIFQCLSDAQLENIVREAHIDQFGRGERIIDEGAAGASMFVMLQGAAQVSVSKNGSTIEVATLKAGDCFGEMSLLTGERRSATIRAQGDCFVMEIDKETMGQVIRDTPECLRQLSEILAARQLETEGIVREASASSQTEQKEREYRATFLARLQKMFSL